MINKLIIAPHADDDVLGCGGILDENSFVIYCGIDEAHISDRPDLEERMQEIIDVQNVTNHSCEILSNKVNNYNQNDLIGDFERLINKYTPEEVYLPHPSYNQDHKAVYNAALIAFLKAGRS